MIDLAFIESLIKALDESSLDSLELERGGTRIRLSKSAPVPLGVPQGFGHVLPASPGAPQSAGSESHPVAPGQDLSKAPALEEEGDNLEGLVEITSPMVGTFYSSPAPDADPYVEVGQRIGEGTVLCIIEAMKLMNELESEVTGTVAKIMVENAQPVEYGQVLFLINPV
jgi:acetyl-CoA carboxylase biotin carboxyl carrier protein